MVCSLLLKEKQTHKGDLACSCFTSSCRSSKTIFPSPFKPSSIRPSRCSSNATMPTALRCSSWPTPGSETMASGHPFTRSWERTSISCPGFDRTSTSTISTWHQGKRNGDDPVSMEPFSVMSLPWLLDTVIMHVYIMSTSMAAAEKSWLSTVA